MNTSHGSHGAPGWTAFVAQLRADRKRAAALGGLVLVLIVLCLHMMGGQNTEPLTAGAGSLLPVQGGPTPVASTPPGATDPARRAAGAEVQQPERAAIAADAYDTVSIQQLSRDLTRDLFSTDWSEFGTSAESATPRLAAASQPSAFSRLWRRWGARILERESEIEDRRKQMETELAALHLQATFLANPPRAVISGRVVNEGEQIGGFRVVRIFARSVMLHKSGLNVRLTMP